MMFEGFEYTQNSLLRNRCHASHIQELYLTLTHICFEASEIFHQDRGSSQGKFDTTFGIITAERAQHSNSRRTDNSARWDLVENLPAEHRKLKKLPRLSDGRTRPSPANVLCCKLA